MRVRSIGDGMAEVVHTTTVPVAVAVVDMAERYARMARGSGNGRTLGQLRSAVIPDLILRPWDTSRPAVTAHLTVLAPLPTLRQRPGAVAEVNGHPSPQQTWVRTRDRTCRHPGCDNAAGWADPDHVTPHACNGSTDCDDLRCLCRRHHRLKTHAPGWRFVLHPHATLSVTTPTGVTRSTQPAGLHALAGMVPVPEAELAGPVDDPPPF